MEGVRNPWEGIGVKVGLYSWGTPRETVQTFTGQRSTPDIGGDWVVSQFGKPGPTPRPFGRLECFGQGGREENSALTITRVQMLDSWIFWPAT